MKTSIIVLLAIYITSVTAIRSFSHDLRFPIDSKVIQGTLINRELALVFYQTNKNNTVIDYSISNTKYSCGLYKIELNESYVYDLYFQMYPLNNQNRILLVTIAQSYPVKIEVVDLSQCKRIELMSPTEDKLIELKITKYTDSFDVYFKDSSICNESYCKKSYDFDGNLVSTPSEVFHSNKSLPLVKPTGSNKLRSNKFLAFEFTKKKTILNLVDSDSK